MRTRLGFAAVAAMVAACGAFEGAEDVPPGAAPSTDGTDGGADGSSIDGTVRGAVSLAAPASIALVRGRTVRVTLTATRDRFDEPIEIIGKTLPQGVAMSTVQVARGGSQIEVALVTDATVPQGTEAEVTFEARRTNGGAALAEVKSKTFVRGAPGEIDTRFGKDGVLDLAFDSRPFAVLPDGRFYLVENPINYDVYFDWVRYAANGAIDTTFGTAGKKRVTGRTLTKVISTGGALYALLANNSDPYLAKLNEDTTPAAGFGSAGEYALPKDAYYTYSHLAVGPTGGVAAIRGGGVIAWVTPTGTADTSVNAQAMTTGAYGGPQAAVRDTTGLTFIASNATIHRHLQNGGGVDTSFGTSNGFTIVTPSGALYSLVADAQGRYVVAGRKADAGPAFVARVTPTGIVDGTFGTAGFADTAGLLSPVATLDESGRIVQASTRLETSVYRCTVQRWTADGKADTDFGTGGRVDLLPEGCVAQAIVPHLDGMLIFGRKIVRVWN